MRTYASFGPMSTIELVEALTFPERIDAEAELNKMPAVFSSQYAVQSLEEAVTLFNQQS